MTQHLSDKELQLITDQNTALPQQRQHLQGCWYCTQRLQEYRSVATLLTSAKPDTEIPAEFAESTTALILQREQQTAEKGDFIATAMICVMILAGIGYAFTNFSPGQTSWPHWSTDLKSSRFVEFIIEKAGNFTGYVANDAGWLLYGIGAVIMLTAIVELIVVSLASKTTKPN